MTTLGSLIGPLLIAMILVALGYTWSCGVYPYRTCRSCHGVGHFRSRILNTVRLCQRCKGAKRTLRVGRRVYNAAVRIRRDIRRAQNRDHRTGR